MRDFEPGGAYGTTARRGGLSATARFYLGFFVVLALVVALAYAAGYRAGIAHAGRAARAAHGTLGSSRP